MENEVAYLKSPIGWMEIHGNEEGITAVKYLNDAPTAIAHVSLYLQECIAQLEAYFDGKLRVFDLPLKLKGTDFQLKVWNELQKIPYGVTISYIDLARKHGNAGAVRAVGHANGQNPVNIIVPCHRVIGANGKLTGYGGGLWRKEWLLKHEKSLSLPGLFDQQCHQ